MDFNLHLGEKLDVLIGERKCVSNVQGITPEGTLYVSNPTYRSINMPVHAGEMLNIIYYRPEGMFSFIGGILRIFTEGDLKMMEVELRSPISKYQRRDFVRFEAALEVNIKVLSDAATVARLTPQENLRMTYDKTPPVVDRKPGYAPMEGQTLDISGGGMRFGATIEYEKDALIECKIDLQNGSVFTTDAQVIRCDPDHIGIYEFVICVQFVNLDEGDRRRIIKYIFDRQIKERKIERENS
jgi:c-di-GMP-binding flagellar brake protein YcgR